MDPQTMSKEEMLNLLVELTNTRFWLAIKRYNRERDAYVTQNLRSIDPVKEPTQMGRIQGIGMGLFDLENGIQMEKDRREKKNAEQTKEIKK